MKAVTITGPDGRPVTVKGKEADLYRAMWRAFLDAPWFRIEKIMPGPGETGGVLAYMVTVKGRHLPEGFEDVLREAMGDPEGGEWVVHVDEHNEQEVLAKFNLVGSCTHYTFAAKRVRDVIRALRARSGAQR